MGHMEWGVVGDSECDLLLTRAWTEMLQGGDLPKLWPPNGKSLSHALEGWKNSAIWFQRDSKGIWGLAWFVEFNGQGLWSIWVRPDKRKSVSAGRFAIEAMDSGLELFGELLTMTGQVSLLKLWKKLGFKIVGYVGGKNPFWIGHKERGE